MRKLLLTSNGFANQIISQEFLKLVGKQPKDIRLLFIPTASRTKEELAYVDISKRELLGLGLLGKNIVVCDLNTKMNYTAIKKYDTVYVCGGNTFYLATKMRESSCDLALREFVDTGKVYVGVSAGSIIAGPDISIAAPFDENDSGMKDWSGLALTQIIMTPHYQSKEKGIIDEFEKGSKHSVERIKDGQALLLVGDAVMIVG